MAVATTMINDDAIWLKTIEGNTGPQDRIRATHP